MKTIPKQFKRHGYDCTLIKRNDVCAIYSLKDQVSGSYHFGVVRIRVRKGCSEFRNIKVNAGDEYLPGTSKWGIDGFTVHGMDVANDRFDSMTHNIETKLSEG